MAISQATAALSSVVLEASVKFSRCRADALVIGGEATVMSVAALNAERIGNVEVVEVLGDLDLPAPGAADSGQQWPARDRHQTHRRRVPLPCPAQAM